MEDLIYLLKETKGTKSSHLIEGDIYNNILYKAFHKFNLWAKKHILSVRITENWKVIAKESKSTRTKSCIK